MKLPAGNYSVKRNHPRTINLPRRGRSGLQRAIQREQARLGRPVYLFYEGHNNGILGIE